MGTVPALSPLNAFVHGLRRSRAAGKRHIGERSDARVVRHAQIPHGTQVRYAGLVRLRQRPETASGVTFMTLEDEHGMVNAIIWKDLADPQRRVMLDSQLMCIHGKVERKEGIQHQIATPGKLEHGWRE